MSMKLTRGEFVGLAYANDDELREFAEEILAENAKLREEVNHLKKGDVLHVLTDQELAERQKHEREMQASIKALDDENAKLKVDVERMFQANVEKNNEILGLLADNAELRELLVEVLHELDKVEKNVSHGWFWEAARELGVEGN